MTVVTVRRIRAFIKFYITITITIMITVGIGNRLYEISGRGNGIHEINGEGKMGSISGEG